MYWVFYKIGKDWIVDGSRKTPQKALDTYVNWVLVYGLENVKLVQDVPNIDQMKAKLTIEIEGMGCAVSPPDEESDVEPIVLDAKEVDEQLIEEIGHESPLSDWGFLARIARIKTMLIRVQTKTESWCGYFVGVGSNDGMYSVLKPDTDGENVRVYYKDITSIAFLGEG